MHPSLRLGLVLTAWVFALPARAPAQTLAAIDPAIVQRITPADFQFWEQQRGLALSLSHDLVIYQLFPDAEPALERVVALKAGSTPDADAMLLYSGKVRHAGEAARPALQRLDLSPDIARQIRAAFRRLLEYRVYAPTKKPYVGDPNDSWWIFLRTGPKEAMAGTVLHSGLHAAHLDEAKAFNQLIDALTGLFEAPPEERDRILTELDRLSAVFAKTGHP